MSEDFEIINKVANSGLVNFDISDLVPKGKRLGIDIKDFLWEGMILREKDFREKEFGNAIRVAVKTLNDTGAFDATFFLTELAVRKRSTAWRIRQATLIALDTTYKFDQFKSKKDDVRRPLRKLTLAVERRNELSEAEEAQAQGVAIAEGLARDPVVGECRGHEGQCDQRHVEA